MRHFLFVLTALLSFTLFLPTASAELRIDVTRGTVQPLPIAIVDFMGTTSGQNDVGDKIASVVRDNLKRSGLFSPVSEAAFIEKNPIIDATPRFSDWRLINSQALVVGKVTEEAGKVVVEFRLWDVFAEQQMVGRRFATTRENWRQLAHLISDAVYTRLTGESGYFDTRIVYIAESGPPNLRKKRLAIMDQDGANHMYLTGGNALTLTPRFSSDEQLIAYMAYEKSQPTVFIYNLQAGKRTRLGSFPGMTFAPRFAPNSNRVIMSMAKGGNTDIYTIDLKSRKAKRLTKARSIETSPSYSPDGKRIVFESDRGGSQQLYTMNSDGSGVQRITFGDGRYATPVWSPRGDLIAFTRMHKGKFYIGVIRPDGSGERMITQSFHVEGPTWAPNGRVLMYFKEKPTGNAMKGRQSKLYTVDLTGHHEQMVRTPGDGSDPAWSPRLRK